MMDSLSPSLTKQEAESAFTLPTNVPDSSRARTVSDSSLSNSTKQVSIKSNKGQEYTVVKLQRNQLKSVLKKTNPTPVLTESQPENGVNFDEEFELTSEKKSKQECCVIS